MLQSVRIEANGGSRVVVDLTIFMPSHFMALQVLAGIEPLLLLEQAKAEAARLAEKQLPPLYYLAGMKGVLRTSWDGVCHGGFLVSHKSRIPKSR